MRFSIITASFRQLSWLKRCVRSVGDQLNVDVEHIIQDAGTGSELEEWIRRHSKARLFVEHDGGMYDAINHGVERATGEVIGILNCDEQYLAGTLERVRSLFRRQPDLDIVAGDYLIVDEKQRLLAFRKVTPLRASMIATDHLYAFTCALFFRRSIFSAGLRFDTSLRSVADGEFVCRALSRGHHAGLLHQYLGVFTWTGGNLSAQPVSRAEDELLRDRLPIWLRAATPLLRSFRHFERLLAGGYRSHPISYAVYAGEEDGHRTSFTCENPSFRYPDI
jgi:glycosyltransferase involved in cell wall biosynthesis